MKAQAIAHPNIALAKYWGKRPDAGNVPAVPSLSITLAGLATRTTVTLDASLGADEFYLAGRRASGEAERRVQKLLGELRTALGRTECAKVESENDFPTASGLASSASGFAALAVAADAAYQGGQSRAQLAAWAQKGSTSAARSLFGGFVELQPGSGAAQVAPGEHLPLEVLVCVTTEAEKEFSSRDAMVQTIAKSPYYPRWVEFAHENFAVQRAALLARDFAALGEALEASALAMHASAIAAGIVYFNDTTLSLLKQVRALRAAGVPAWASMDAGPHVKVFVPAGDAAERAAQALAPVPGVVRLIRAVSGEGARTVEQGAS